MIRECMLLHDTTPFKMAIAIAYEIILLECDVRRAMCVCPYTEGASLIIIAEEKKISDAEDWNVNATDCGAIWRKFDWGFYSLVKRQFFLFRLELISEGFLQRLTRRFVVVIVRCTSIS